MRQELAFYIPDIPEDVILQSPPWKLQILQSINRLDFAAET
jgi:hypothetical protein